MFAFCPKVRAASSVGGLLAAPAKTKRDWEEAYEGGTIIAVASRAKTDKNALDKLILL
jgi:D-tyrosyl-tRNA(Tyr) deacylase